MTRFDNRLLWGGVLILAGLLFLLQNLGIFLLDNLVWTIFLGIAGLSFLYIVFKDRRRWWAIIPGVTISYLAFLILMDQLYPSFSNGIGGALFLASIGASFWIIYFLNRSFWWAIIPAGVLVTLGVVAAFDQYFSGIETGGIFFIGLGLTFALLAWIPTSGGRMRWPLIPAGVLTLMGVLISFASTSLFRLVWPVALILAGLYLFFRRIPSHSS
ncbi:MAG: hypothetical protein PHQ40_03225 [Anaerolineaceae bacterium]|nr:hypothetical protein [Anaerolineaceae bacterium]